MANFFKVNDPIGDTPIFHVTMLFFVQGYCFKSSPPASIFLMFHSFHHTQPFLIAKLGSLKEPESMFLKKKNGSVSLLEKLASTSSKHLFFASPPEGSGDSLNMANSSLER